MPELRGVGLSGYYSSEPIDLLKSPLRLLYHSKQEK